MLRDESISYRLYVKEGIFHFIEFNIYRVIWTNEKIAYLFSLYILLISCVGIVHYMGFFWTLPILCINELADPADSTLQVSAVRSTARRGSLIIIFEQNNTVKGRDEVGILF